MQEWHCVVNGQKYGPISMDQLSAWAREGRIKPDSMVWTTGMADWAPAGSVPGLFPPSSAAPPTVAPPPVTTMAPHRGVMILVFGILGLACCVVFGIVAWVMGNSDLRDMDQGKMDPSGRGMTQAGRICGIISVIIAIAGFIIWLIAAAAGGLAGL